MKLSSLFTLLLLSAGSLVSTAGAAEIDASRVLDGLRAGHPRVLATAGRFEELREELARDATLAAWFAALQLEAKEILAEPPLRYAKPDGKRLLHVSRDVQRRVLTLALVHRIAPDEALVERAWQELEGAAAFPDWNPAHFLDTAVMSAAFACGYDWLYADWSESQRKALRGALLRHGLRPGLACYRGEAKYGWWTAAVHNWNQVCNGGLVMAALAVADDEPAVAREIIAGALASLPRAMAEYAPDGGYKESPAYWVFGTQYNVAALAALESALGRDFGLAEQPGFGATGHFPLYMTGPTGLPFNFGDGREKRLSGAETLLWLAGRFDRPACARFAHALADPGPLDLLWYRGRPDAAAVKRLPLGRAWDGPRAVTLRSAWEDPRATFVGFKGARPQDNHAQLDAGTFVLDAHSVRWAIDLGKDDYNLPGYFDRGGKRWTYYRNRAEGHNTLLIAPSETSDQQIRAETHIERFELAGADETPSTTRGGGNSLAIADLTAAYRPNAGRVRRGVALRAAGDVVVQDEIEAEGADVWWFLHTRAALRLADEGRTAHFSQGGEMLRAHLVEPADARFTVERAAPLPASPDPSGQTANKGVRKLSIQIADVRKLRIVVRLSPGAATPLPAAIEAQPLDAW